MGKSVEIKDKVILITGASSGIGEAAGRQFAREGGNVILCARRIDRLNALAEEIHAFGGRATAISLDVTEQAEIEATVQSVLEKFGRIDILFNNAGFGYLNWLERLEPAVDIDIQLDVNLRGMIQVTRAVLPAMIERHSGTIINMSSVAGILPAPMYSIYAASKFGIRGFTNALRREVMSLGIHVCGIYPGPAVTEFSSHTGGDNAIRRIFKPPTWLYMTSGYVGRKVVQLAKAPRRMLVIPWWFRLLYTIDILVPWLVDWFLQVVIVKRAHQP